MRFRNLDRITRSRKGSRREIEVPPPRTPDGRIYRYSPNEAALPRHFLIGDVVLEVEPTQEQRGRMKLQPRSEQTVCPYSGIVAEDRDFVHPEDMEAAVTMVKDAAMRDVEDAFAQIFDGRNRRSSSRDMFSFTVSQKRRHRVRPRFYRKDLLRELVCDHCGRDYGVYAIALFCPDCGAPNLALHFRREIELIDSQVELADAQKASQELSYRLLGNAHEDVLTGFEAAQKTFFRHAYQLRNNGELPARVGNDFQNIQKAEKRYRELGFNPFQLLDTEDFDFLTLNIQKRHVIGHNLGVVDEKFAERSIDAKVGETVSLVGDEVRRFADIASRVVGFLDTWLGEQPVAEPDFPNRGEPTEQPIPTEQPMKQQSIGEKLGLSELAGRIGSILIVGSKDGLSRPVDEELLEQELSDVEHALAEEAIAELGHDGYVSISRAIGTRWPGLRLLPEIFAAFDPLVIGQNPWDDSMELAKRVLASEQDGTSIPELHESTGWDIRRFNPAAYILLDQIDGRRVSKTNIPGYPTAHFALLPEDRVQLRRHVDRGTGS